LSRPLILFLGNELLSDDAFGPELYARLAHDTDLEVRADLVSAPVAGFYLLDFLAGHRRALIVDSIQSGREEPGTIHYFRLDPAAPGRHLTGSHQISLPTALALGRQLGYDMPDQVDVLAVEAADVVSLGGALTPAVEASLDKAERYVREWVTTGRRQLPVEREAVAG
jgi:hydrogenase maturation protease